MAHLKNFGVGNFRAFKDTYNFDFAPITILTGTNSSGKSSLTKAILVLRESIQNINRTFSELNIKSLMKLKFGQEIQLGNFNTVKNFASESNEIIFELPFKLPECEELLSLRLIYVNDKTEKNNGALYSMQLINPMTNDCLLEVTENDKGFYRKVNYQELWNLLQQNKVDTAKINKRASFKDEEFFKCESLNSDCIYHSEINNIAEFQNGIDHKLMEFYDSTLLNYLFLYKPEYVEENIRNWYPELSKDEIDNLLMDFYKARNQLLELKKTNESLVDVIRELEFKALNKEEQFDDFVLKKNKEITYAIPHLGEIMGSTGKGGEVTYDSIMKGWKQRGNNLFQKIIASDTLLAEILKNELMVIDCVPNGVSYPDISVGNYFFEAFLKDGFHNMFNILKRVFSTIDYIPSVRTKVERYYKSIPTESFLQDCIDKFQNEKKEPAAIAFFDKWVEKFGIAEKVLLSISEDSAATKIELLKGGKTIQLADVGYGYAQLLPILLKLTMQINQGINGDGKDRIKIPSVLIIEEPETNLHPALQSKLADMFVECYQKYNIQLIIETHSEYLIRRLQRRTAEFYSKNKKNEFSIPEDFTQIYYFYPPDNVPEGENQIYPINIQKDGALTKNFGIGFFDEAGNEDLLLYQIAKHNKN